MNAPARFEVYLVELDPTRPCTVVSPDEMNRHLRTIIVAPITTGGKDYPTRVPILFQGHEGKVALDQLRTVDRGRLFRKLGSLTEEEAERLLFCLGQMFAA